MFLQFFSYFIHKYINVNVGGGKVCVKKKQFGHKLAKILSIFILFCLFSGSKLMQLTKQKPRIFNYDITNTKNYDIINTK